MERKIKWFVFEHYVGYTITDLLMKYFTVFAVGFIVAPLVQMTEMGSYDSINLTDKGIIPLMIVLGVFATVFSIFFTIMFVINKKWSLLAIRLLEGVFVTICSFLISVLEWNGEQIIVRNIAVLILSFALCLLCGFLYFLYLIKKYIPNVQVGQDNESSKSMMFAAPAFVMAVRPILLSFSPIPTIQFLIYGVSCATFVMTVEWGTRAYLAKLYNLK
jgi:predicted neutral ceramidase superfamily lipid hydrolase